MSLYDQIKEEHLFCTTSSPKESFCSCDQAFYSWEHREREHEAHVIAEFEKALRTQIAAEIQRRKRDMAGGYADTAKAMLEVGMEEAARIAEGTNQ